MRLLRRLLGLVAVSGVLASSISAQELNAALLSALDEADFWSAEDKENRGELRTAIAENGIGAIYNSERLIILDAETLAEGGILDALERLRPHLELRGAVISSLSEVQNDGETYIVEVNGARYDVYSPAELAGDPYLSWGLASETLFRIVNNLLADTSDDRFFALNGGNDLSGFFLPPAVVPHFAAAGTSKRDLPYFPTRQPPWFGMGHDG